MYKYNQEKTAFIKQSISECQLNKHLIFFKCKQIETAFHVTLQCSVLVQRYIFMFNPQFYVNINLCNEEIKMKDLLMFFLSNMRKLNKIFKSYRQHIHTDSLLASPFIKDYSFSVSHATVYLCAKVFVDLKTGFCPILSSHL